MLAIDRLLRERADAAFGEQPSLPSPIKHQFDQLIAQMDVAKLAVRIEDDEWASLAKVFLRAVLSIIKANSKLTVSNLQSLEQMVELNELEARMYDALFE